MGASNSPELRFSKYGKDGKPRQVERVLKVRAVAKMDRVEKERVRLRDKEACRVCFRATRDVHERLFKSLGGVASLENSLCACRVCHPFLQTHAIQVYGLHCSAKLRFEMAESVSHIVFRGRAVPSHVRVIVPSQRLRMTL